jgi:hypothetical protein
VKGSVHDLSTIGRGGDSCACRPPATAEDAAREAQVHGELCGEELCARSYVARSYVARMFTARETINPIVTSDTSAWMPIVLFAIVLSGIVSVGENAVALVSDTYR